MKKLLYFHADWCPPCRFYDKTVITPLIDRIGAAKIERIDADRNPRLVDMYYVDRLPVIVLLDDDRILMNRYATLSVDKLEEALED